MKNEVRVGGVKKSFSFNQLKKKSFFLLSVYVVAISYPHGKIYHNSLNI